MRKHRWIHAAFLSAALFGTTSLVHAQTGTTTGSTSSSSSGSTSTGTSSSLGPSLSTSSSSTMGTTGQGIATLSGTGGTGGGKGGGAGSSASTAIPASSDRFAGTYANPLYMGINGVSTTFTTSGTAASGSASQTYFGKAIYATTTTGTTGATSSSILNLNQGGFSTIGMSKAPPYRTVLGSGVPLARPAGAELQGAILNSLAASPLKDKNGILLKVDGSTVFLRGQVADDSERRIIEGFVRMTPGVRDVVNQLVPLVTASND